MYTKSPKLHRIGRRGSRHEIKIAENNEWDMLEIYHHPKTLIASIGLSAANELHLWLMHSTWSTTLKIASSTYQNVRNNQPYLVKKNEVDDLIFWEMGTGTGKMVIVGTNQSTVISPKQIDNLKWAILNKSAENRLMKFTERYRNSDQSAVLFTKNTGVSMSKGTLKHLFDHRSGLRP